MHASEMYLVTLVNATFVGRRPAGHVELVDLSVEKKAAEQRYNDKNGHQQLRILGSADHHDENRKTSAGLCMEPLMIPLFLESPSSSESSEADTRERQIIQVTKPQPEDTLPSKHQEHVEPTHVADAAMKTIKPSKTRVAPKLGSLFSDSGIPTRVQHHPLEMIAEQERDSDSDLSPRATNRSTAAAPDLPHPLARIDESPVKPRPVKEKPVSKNSPKENPMNEGKATMKKGEKAAIPTPSPNPVRKVVREAKPQPQKREQRRAPVTKPRNTCPKPRSTLKPTSNPKPRSNPKPKVPEAVEQPEVTDPSLANPVMERMPQIASPEPPYAWSTKLPKLPKLEVTSMDIEDQLRNSSPKMTEWDAQDDLSFRVWERESNPKRKSISVSRDFQDSLDLEDGDQLTILGNTQQISPPGIKTKPTTDPRRKKEEPECPSPSSFTCGLSTTSLFSDDDEESSDVDFDRRSFSTFIYTDPMGETSSDESAEFHNLRYFQEAGHREPWLVDAKDGAAVLDATDLQFLLKDEQPEISEDVISTPAPPARRHSRSPSFSKSKRSVRFSPELVRKMSAPNTSIRLPPLPTTPAARDDDEQIYPSVKSWEVEDDAPTVASPPRRSWRRSPSPKPKTPRRWRRPCSKLLDADQATAAPIRRRDQILPCAGRLFSWPQRLASRVSRSRRLEVSDDESVMFGGSARRDAQQVRRILKGGAQKNVAVESNLKVADILDENFAR